MAATFAFFCAFLLALRTTFPVVLPLLQPRRPQCSLLQQCKYLPTNASSNGRHLQSCKFMRVYAVCHPNKSLKHRQRCHKRCVINMISHHTGGISYATAIVGLLAWRVDKQVTTPLLPEHCLCWRSPRCSAWPAYSSCSLILHFLSKVAPSRKQQNSLLLHAVAANVFHINATYTPRLK